MIVVTGTGRCGTGYVAKLLTSAGVECKHEGFFNAQNWGHAVERMLESDLPANSSWMMAPFLDKLPDPTVVHLVRHPKHVVDSLRRIGFFNVRMCEMNKPYSDFAKKYCPEAWQYNMTKMAATAFYVAWNRMIEEKAPDAIFHRIEDDDTELLDKLGIDYEGKELFSNEQYNHRDGPIVSDVNLKKRIWDPVKSDIAQMMDEYGYEHIEPKSG